MKSRDSMGKKTFHLYLNLLSLLTVKVNSMKMIKTLQNGFDLTSCPPIDESPPSNYNIKLVNMGNTGSRYDEVFRVAASRWEKIILGDVEDVNGTGIDDWFYGFFSEKYTGPVDDVVIGYEVSDSAVDGLGGRIGIAGNIHTRKRNGVTTSAISGIMKFDEEDFNQLSDSDLIPVIIHEMGHVLGLVGTIGNCANGCGTDTTLTPYQCELAMTEYTALTGRRELLTCGHWDGEGFRTELSSEMMSGVMTEGVYSPISLVSVAALADIGYEVDYCGADHWPAGDPNVVQRHTVYATGKVLEGGVSTVGPTQMPFASPTETPTSNPVPVPTQAPVARLTVAPTTTPIASPTKAPTMTPLTASPVKAPTTTPIAKPTKVPTAVPVSSPTSAPVVTPTKAPTSPPVVSPTMSPTLVPVAPTLISMASTFTPTLIAPTVSDTTAGPVTVTTGTEVPVTTSQEETLAESRDREPTEAQERPDTAENEIGSSEPGNDENICLSSDSKSAMWGSFMVAGVLISVLMNVDFY